MKINFIFSNFLMKILYEIAKAMSRFFMEMIPRDYAYVCLDKVLIR